MDILVKPFILDIIIVCFVMIMMFLGYKKGFVVRLYDFGTTLLSLLIAYVVYVPLGKTWIIYSLQPPLQDIGQTVNQFFVFIVVFAVFKLACKILGIFIKPVIKKMFSILKTTKLLDSLLGLFFSMLESLLLIYIALVIVVSPLLNGGQDIISQSIIGHMITETVPFYSQELLKMELIHDLTDIDLDTKDTSCVTLVTEILYQLDENEWIDDETLTAFMFHYYQDIDNVSLNQKTYDMIKDMCQKNNLDSQDILKGIEVNDEDEE